MATTALINKGIRSGRYYRTKYRAKNEVGFGTYSEISYVLAASTPLQPNLIVAEIIGDQIKITW